MTNREIKLLPCPFCGNTTPQIANNRIGDCYVVCTTSIEGEYACGASTSERSCETEEKAAALWNTRVHPASTHDTMQDALEQIVQWADAYPLKAFPEPDFKKAAEVLKAAGMTLDSVSASNMRHCIKGVGEIARNALAAAALSPQPQVTEEEIETLKDAHAVITGELPQYGALGSRLNGLIARLTGSAK